MGGDGGTKVVRRDCIVKLKKRQVVVDPRLTLNAKWQHCYLTADLLKEPVVADELGRIYNRESILMFKLEKDSQTAERQELMKHVRGLKDVTTLKLTKTPGWVENAGERYDDRGRSQWCCPVLQDIEMNGHNGFQFNRGCGCVISEKALREAPSDRCLSCDRLLDGDEHPIKIMPQPEEEKMLLKEMEARRKQAKLAKKRAKAASKLMGPPQLPGASAGAVAPKSSGDGKRKATGFAPSAAKQPKIGKHINSQKIRSVAPGSSTAMKEVKALPDMVTDDERASKNYKALFASSKKDPNKNMQNSSIGSFTSRTTYSFF